MMQSVGALSNEAAAVERSEMVQQQMQVQEQMDHNTLEQLAKRMSALEAGKNAAGHQDDAHLESQLQAETTQVEAQNGAVKEQATKTQDIMTRLETLEKAQKQKQEDKQTGILAHDKKRDEKDAEMLRRLEAVEQKLKSSPRQDSTNNRTEVALKDIQSQLASMKEELDATKEENAELRAEVQKLKAAPPVVPSSNFGKQEEDDDDSKDDDTSLLQFRHRHHEQRMPTFFNRKIRHHKK